jgi:riboflavin synthase
VFTGIIAKVGTVKNRRRSVAGLSLSISGLGLADGVSPGDSVSINGVCQTLERVTADGISFTAVGETLSRTTIGSLPPGSRVNLEVAARADSFLGGHIVQGHVDGVATVYSFVKTGSDWLLKVRLPRELRGLVVPKGSIALDGVSLTVIDATPAGLVGVTVVPYTITHTIAGSYRSGVKVNVETDIIGKYVRRYVEGTGGGRISK